MNKRILLIGHFLSGRGGTFSASEAFAQALRAAGWQVVTTSSQPNAALKLADMLATIVLRRRDYALAQVAVYSGNAFVWAEACCRLLHALGKPYVLMLHGGQLVAFAAEHEGRVRRLLASADAVVTPSHFLRNGLQRFRPDLTLIPNGLDLSRFPPRVRTQAAPRLVWLRALHEVYDPVMAVETLARVKARCPDARLTLFGPDKGDGSAEAVRQAADRAGISANVTLGGTLTPEQVPGALTEYDIFLNTTRAESFGVSVIEAGALGLCIVTTNVGELPHLWTDGEDALLVSPGDAEAMADAVLRILTEPGLAERLSRRARVTAEQFDWSRVLPQWDALLNEVAS